MKKLRLCYNIKWLFIKQFCEFPRDQSNQQLIMRKSTDYKIPKQITFELNNILGYRTSNTNINILNKDSVYFICSLHMQLSGLSDTSRKVFPSWDYEYYKTNFTVSMYQFTFSLHFTKIMANMYCLLAVILLSSSLAVSMLITSR